MKVSIAKSEARGEVQAPPSKSYTIRSLICSGLAQGKSTILHPLVAEDTMAASDVLRKIGVEVKHDSDWQLSGGEFNNNHQELYCGESAATLRFMTAICAAIPGKWLLTAGPSLARRPVEPLIQALRQLNIDCSSNNGFAPVTINGGKVRGGAVRLPGDISSQFISALLLLSPLAENGLQIELTTPPESVPYILMTLDCMKQFGIEVRSSPELDRFEVANQSYRPIRYIVEGDWSSASYLLALGAVSGDITVKNLNTGSLQADKRILDILNSMGAKIIQEKDNVRVVKSDLQAINMDLSDCIDLLPTAAVLAAAAGGTSQLTGTRRAKIKESNRVVAIKDGLERMGIRVSAEDDRMTVTGSYPRGAIINSYNDHRIAMAFSVPGSIAGNTTIDGAECVAKTFPEYWKILKKIGVKVASYGQ